MKYFISKKVRPVFLSTLIVLMILSFFSTVILYENKPQKAAAASKYWKGGAVGDTTNWNNANNWAATSGGAGGAGVPGPTDDVIFNAATSAVNCNLAGSVQVASITNLNSGGWTRILAVSTYTLTVTGDLTWNRGSISATTGGLTVSGVLTFSGGTFTYGTSTVTLNGSNKAFYSGGQSYYNLVIDGSIVNYYSSPTIRHNLTVNSSKTFGNTGGKISFINGATLTLDGTIDGPGIYEFIDSTSSTITGSGTISSPVDFRTSTVNITVPARAYGGRIEIVNYSNSDYIATLGTAAGQTITCGGFAVSNYYLPYYQGGGDITVNGDTYDPDVVINGGLKVGGTGAGTRTLSMGDGDWSIAGSFNVAGGTLTNTNGTVSINGSQSYGWNAVGSGINSDVYSMTTWDGKLVIGTNWMTVAGGVTAHGVAVWDGFSWSALGDGIEGDVYAVGTYNGDLIAAGYLSGSGVDTNYGPMRWNGSDWVELGTWVDQWDIFCMIEFQGKLIIGGDFETVGAGTAAAGVAAWDGASWTVLGSGASGIVTYFGASVKSLAIYNNQLVAAGNFKVSSGSVADYIANWDGAAWNNMGTGLTVYNYIDELLVDGTNLYAAGSLGTSGAIKPVALWNGASWSFVGDGQLEAEGLALAKFNGDIYAGGYFYSTTSSNNKSSTIAKLNGSNWEPVDGGSADGHIHALQVIGDSLYVGGTSSRIGSASATFIARYSHPYLSFNSNNLNNLTLTNLSGTPVTLSDSLTLAGTFTDTTADSEVNFHAGSTYTFPTINIGGTSGHHVVLDSTSNAVWNLNVAAASPTVSEVTASYSDASGGSEIDASDGTSTNGNNNVHWNFGSSPPVPPPPPPPAPPSPPPTPSGDDGTGSGEDLVSASPMDLVSVAIAASYQNYLTDDSNDQKFLLSARDKPEVYGSYPIFSGNSKPNTELIIKILKDGVVIVDDSFFSGPNGDYRYQTKEALQTGEYQVTISESSGGRSDTYNFVVKSTPLEQINRITEEARIGFQDIFNALRETNSKPLNIILLIIATFFMINGLMNAFTGFFSAQISARQYFLAFLNSFIVVGGKRKKIGYVFDSGSRKKLQGALVSLFEAGAVKLRGTSFTDKNGHYIFSVDKGSYVLSVKKNGYIFPSQYRVDVSENYYGQPLNYEQDSTVIKEIIPVDAVNNALRKESIYFKIYVNVFISAIIRWVVLLSGTMIAVFALILNPVMVNFIILGCYVILYILEFILQHKESSYCRIIDARTHKAVDLALVRIYNSDKKLVGTYVADRQGRVNPYVEEGNFTVEVERVGYEKSQQFILSPKALLSKKIYLKPNL